MRGFALAGAACLAAASFAAPSGASSAHLPAPAARAQGAPVVSDAVASRMAAALRDGHLAEQTSTHRLCATNHLRCDAEVVTAAGTSKPISSSRPIGYGANDLTKAYDLIGAKPGSGTVAIVDLAAYPTAAADLAKYRSKYHLPACTASSGCFTAKRYDGGAALKPAKSKLGREIEEEIAVETSLDLDMASASCPSCKLILLQVPPHDLISGSKAGLHAAEVKFATAVRTAKSLGATSVSISYGFPADNFTNTGRPARLMDVRGIAVTASTGDGGANVTFPLWPAALRSVIAVGGTSLSRSQTTKQYSEAAWSYAGSGCTTDLARAFGQPSSVARNCKGHRASADISAVADPQTGVAVYDGYAPFSHTPYKWIVVGGTSASSPYIAGLYSRAGVPAGVHGPNKLYGAPASAFHDVTVGGNAPRGACTRFGISERVCMADVGWDGPTGRGTPVGLAPFR